MIQQCHGHDKLHKFTKEALQGVLHRSSEKTKLNRDGRTDRSIDEEGDHKTVSFLP